MTDEEYIRFMQQSTDARIKARMWNISRAEVLIGTLGPIVLLGLVCGLLAWMVLSL